MSVGYIRNFFGDDINWERFEKFSFANTLSKDWVKIVTFAHERFLQRIEEESKEPIRPFQPDTIFRAPDNVNNLWVSEVALASAYVVHFQDTLNIVLNGGRILSNGGEVRRYKDKKELDFLRQVSSKIEEIEGYVNETLKQKEEYKQTSLMMLSMFNEQQIECVYNAIAQTDRTFYKTIVKLIPKEKFYTFMTEMTKELKLLIKSEKTETLLMKWGKTLQDKMNTIDFDLLTSKDYLIFLKARALVLGVDVHQVFEDLNEVHVQLQKGFWEMRTGQWPELVQFISNLYLNTFVSEEFWKRVDDLYYELLKQYKGLYEERQKKLETSLNDGVLPFFRATLMFMVQIREGKRTVVDESIEEFEKIDLNSIIYHYTSKVTEVLSRQFLSCFTELHGKPDFELWEAAIVENAITKSLKKLVFTNWPKEKIIPKGMETFIEKLANGVLLIFTSVFGSCSRVL